MKGVCHLPVEEEVPRVILDTILLTKSHYCLPIGMTNGKQHNVLERYHMLTHFPFWLIVWEADKFLSMNIIFGDGRGKY